MMITKIKNSNNNSKYCNTNFNNSINKKNANK